MKSHEFLPSVYRIDHLGRPLDIREYDGSLPSVFPTLPDRRALAGEWIMYDLQGEPAAEVLLDRNLTVQRYKSIGRFEPSILLHWENQPECYGSFAELTLFPIDFRAFVELHTYERFLIVYNGWHFDPFVLSRPGVDEMLLTDETLATIKQWMMLRREYTKTVPHGFWLMPNIYWGAAIGDVPRQYSAEFGVSIFGLKFHLEMRHRATSIPIAYFRECLVRTFERWLIDTALKEGKINFRAVV